MLFAATIYLSVERDYYTFVMLYVINHFRIFLLITLFIFMVLPVMLIKSPLYLKFTFIILYLITFLLYTSKFQIDLMNGYNYVVSSLSYQPPVNDVMLLLFFILVMVVPLFIYKSVKAHDHLMIFYLSFLLLNIIIYMFSILSGYLGYFLIFNQLLGGIRSHVLQALFNLMAQDVLIYLSIAILLKRLYANLFKDNLRTKHKHINSFNAILNWFLFGMFGFERLYLGTKKWITLYHLSYLAICTALYIYNDKMFSYETIWNKNPIFLVIFIIVTAGQLILMLYSLFEMLVNKPWDKVENE